jgi:glycerol kinase
MENRYLIGIDQSTSGTKAILFNQTGTIVKRVDVPHAQKYPSPGWVEHDPEELVANTLLAAQTVLKQTGIAPGRVAAVALTNQRETVVVWNRRTGKPVYNAVVWQCRRGADICTRLEASGAGKMVKEKTGLILSPYFSASKIAWILEEVPGAREAADCGELLCGTIDSWLIWNLSGGTVHATDYSNASRTQLFNLSTLDWDDELLRLFGIPRSMLAETRFSDEEFGRTDLGGILPSPIPITGVMGDSHAALFGQNCFSRGMAKASYGTGSSIMMHIGDKPVLSERGLVTSVAWGRGGTVEFVLEGNINCAGSTLSWLADDLGLIDNAKDAGTLASTVPDTEGVYLVPAFVGLGAPYWDSKARASISGITRGTKKAHVVRAAVESIAYQIKDILDLMVEESTTELTELRVDGGLTNDAFLMQFQADILGIRVAPSAVEELSATGSVYMAGLATGFWASKAEIESLRGSIKPYSRTMDGERVARLYAGWKEAINKTLCHPQRMIEV